MVTDIGELREAVHMHATRAGEKLRRQSSSCSTIAVLLGTNPFLPGEPQYHPMSSMPMPYPADDFFSLARVAINILNAIYRPGFRYKKAGVMLMELTPVAQLQGSLFNQAHPSHVRLSHLMDSINKRMGRDTIKLAGAGTRQPWVMKRDKMSPAFTSSWREIVRVRA